MDGGDNTGVVAHGIDVEVTRRDTDRKSYQIHWAMIDNMAETITSESTPTWRTGTNEPAISSQT